MRAKTKVREPAYWLARFEAVSADLTGRLHQQLTAAGASVERMTKALKGHEQRLRLEQMITTMGITLYYWYQYEPDVQS